MTTSTIREVEHEITIGAPAARVYELIADVGQWPEMFPPTVHAIQAEQGQAEQGQAEKGQHSELIRIWATANGTARSWTSRRQHDPAKLTIGFRQERSVAPVGGMGGLWMVEPVSDGQCQVRLRHDYFACNDNPADLEWIGQAVDRNSTAELTALKERAELDSTGELFSFADTVEVDGSARDVYDFLNEAQLWRERLPHVARVSLEEETPGLQILEMDTRAKDGSVHTTRSVRVCQPCASIIYKQIVLPPLMLLHTGRWLIEPREGGGVAVTSRHTVRINPDRIAGILGPGATLLTAQDGVRAALSANSLATLTLAKAHAEEAGRRLAAS